MTRLGQFPLAELNRELDVIEGLLDSVRTEKDRMRIGNEINGKIRRAKESYDAVKDDCSEARLRNTTKRMHELTDRTLIEIFGFNPEEAQQIREHPPTPKHGVWLLPKVYVDCSASVTNTPHLRAAAWDIARRFRKEGCEILGFSDGPDLITINRASDMDKLGRGTATVPVIRDANGDSAVIITDGALDTRLPPNFKIIDTRLASSLKVDVTTFFTPQEATVPNPTTRPVFPAITVLDAYVGRDVSAFQVQLDMGTGPDGVIVAEGSAKRHDPDEPNILIGRDLALGRALVDIGDTLVRAATQASEHSCVVHNHANVGIDFVHAEAAAPADVVDGRRHRKHVEHLNERIEALNSQIQALSQEVVDSRAEIAKKDQQLARQRKAAAKARAAAKTA